MGRHKTVEGDTSNAPLMSIYCPSSLKSDEQKVCKLLGVSLSERTRELFKRDIAEHLGKESSSDFPYEDKKNELLQLMHIEDKLVKDLQKEELTNRRSAYEELCAFAVALSGDKTLTKDPEKVLYKLHHYDHKGTEPFSKRHLEMFIQRYEILIKVQALQAKIDAHRKNGFHKEDAVARLSVLNRGN
jgi:hypothetical protein